MIVRHVGKLSALLAGLMGTMSAFAADPVSVRVDDGVVFKGVVIHNVMDLVEGSGGRYEFRRAGAAVHEHLSEMGRERNANNTGVELRFVLKGDTATIRLGGKTDDAVSQIHIHYGDILGDWPNCTRTVIGKDAEITIQRQTTARRPGDRFDPSVVRLVLPYGDLGIYDVTGDVEPPSASLLPRATYLAYGSSITHGGNAYIVEECYASLVGDGLGADVRNLGFAGSAYLENAMADFLAEQKFDYATLEMGVNVVDFMGEAEYESRVRYLVDKVASSHPKAVILAIDIFGWVTGDTARDQKAERYRAILRRVVSELSYPNVAYVNGLEILPNDTEISLGAGVHPTPKGHRLIAEGLIKRFRQAEDDMVLRNASAVAKTMARPSDDLKFSFDMNARTLDAAFPVSDAERLMFIAFGATDGGSDMTAWDNVLCATNVLPGETSVSGVVLPDEFGDETPVMRVFIERKLDAGDYLRQGLVAQYDGLDNVGIGRHAAQTSVWTDLVGGKNIVLKEDDSVSDDFVEIGRTAHPVSGIFTKFGPMTMEVDFTITSTDDAMTGFVPFNVPAIGGIGFDRNTVNKAFAFRGPAYENRSASGIMWWDNPYGNFASFMAAGGSADVSYTPNYDPNGVVYINGTKYDKSSGPWGTAYNGDLAFYLGAAEVTLRVRSIRLYDRELTDSERLYNRTLDRMRFEGFRQISVYSVSAEVKCLPRPLYVKRICKDGSGRPQALELEFSASEKPRKLFLAYGVSDGGNDMTAWDESVELGSVFANVVSATMTIPEEHRSALANAGGFRIFIQRAATAADYAQDGLVALYDAIENAGWGQHVAVATAWRDLVGSHDITFANGDSLGNKSVTITPAVRQVQGIFTKFGPMTMEVDFTVASTDDATTGFVPFNVPAIGAIGFDRNAVNKAFAFRSPAYENRSASGIMWWNNPYGNFASFMAAGGSADVSYTPNYDPNGVVYINGTKYDKSSGPWGTAYNGDLAFYLGAAEATLQVQSIRLYDRELEEAVRLRNNAIDNERYRNGSLSVCECSAFVRPNPRGLCIVVK